MDKTESKLEQALALVDRLDLDGAIRLLEDQVLDDPSNPLHIIELGVVLIQTRRPSQAIVALEKALGYNEQNPSTLGYLGQAHFFNGTIDNARGYFVKSLDFDPQNLAALNGLGMLENSEGNYSAAEQVLTTALDELGPIPPLLTERAYARAQQRNYNGAIDDCTLALETEPCFVPALQSRSALYEATGRTDLAALDGERLSSLANAADLLKHVQSRNE